MRTLGERDGREGLAAGESRCGKSSARGVERRRDLGRTAKASRWNASACQDAHVLHTSAGKAKSSAIDDDEQSEACREGAAGAELATGT